MRIVVGFDGSADSSAALAWAVAEARLHEASLTIVTVHAEDAPEDAVTTIRGTVAKTVEDYPFEHESRHGSPTVELSRAARDADLVVVGSRGRSAIAGLVLGSVSRSILHDARCPVVVVPPGAWPLRRRGRIVAGVDGSADARAALELADREAQVRGADLMPVHAVYWEPLGVEWVQPSAHDLLTWGRRLLDGELGQVELRSPVRPMVVHGHAADVLIRFSKQADLLVLGSRGRGQLASVIFGSVANHCVAHAHCPVVVTRSTAARAD